MSRIVRTNYQVRPPVVLPALENVLGKPLHKDLVCPVIWTHSGNVRREQRGAFRHDCELQRTPKITYNLLRNKQNGLT